MDINPITQLEIIQQNRDGSSRIVGPLEDLDRLDLEPLIGMQGLGIQPVKNYERYFRECDVIMTDSRVVEMWELRNPLLLSTVLKGMVKRKKCLTQLLAWLNQEAISAGLETYIREVHAPFRVGVTPDEAEKTKGPQALDGENLLIAMQNAPMLVPSKEQDGAEEDYISCLFDNSLYPKAGPVEIEIELNDEVTFDVEIDLAFEQARVAHISEGEASLLLHN